MLGRRHHQTQTCQNNSGDQLQTPRSRNFLRSTFSVCYYNLLRGQDQAPEWPQSQIWNIYNLIWRMWSCWCLGLTVQCWPGSLSWCSCFHVDMIQPQQNFSGRSSSCFFSQQFAEETPNIQPEWKVLFEMFVFHLVTTTQSRLKIQTVLIELSDSQTMH